MKIIRQFPQIRFACSLKSGERKKAYWLEIVCQDYTLSVFLCRRIKLYALFLGKWFLPTAAVATTTTTKIAVNWPKQWRYRNAKNNAQNGIWGDLRTKVASIEW